MKKKLIAAILAVSIGTASFGAVLPVEAIGLGGMIKGGAIGLVIDKYGSFNNIARVKGLVPVNSANPVGASRIQGVGVSAIIDLKI